MSAVTKPFLKPYYAETTTTVVNLDHVKAVFPITVNISTPAGAGSTTQKYAIRFLLAVNTGGASQESHIDWIYTTQGDRNAELQTFYSVYCGLVSGASSSSTVSQ